MKRLIKIISGGLITILGCIIAPLPGPGGVPIILAGLALLATEFDWARRLMERLKRYSGVEKFNKQNRMRQAGIILGIVTIHIVMGVVIFKYLY